MTWMCVTLTVDDIVNKKHMQLQDQFEAMFMSNRAPEDVAMFDRHPNPDTYEYYFSPAASALFQHSLYDWGATKCAAPGREGTTLLVGHAGALDMLDDAKS